MEHVVRPCDRIRPASVCIEVGCHEFDLSRVRRNLADGRAHFLAPTELPDGRANAPAIAEKLGNAVTGNVAGPPSDEHQTARGRRCDRRRCHGASPLLPALSERGDEFSIPRSRFSWHLLWRGFLATWECQTPTSPYARAGRKRVRAVTCTIDLPANHATASLTCLSAAVVSLPTSAFHALAL